MNSDLDNLIESARQLSSLCRLTAENLSQHADKLERSRRWWRIIEVTFAVVGIMSQQPVVSAFFVGHATLPLFISSACFLALVSSSIYHANVVSDTPERIRDHLRYIDEYAAKIAFITDYTNDEPADLRRGRIEELFRLAKFNLNDARQKWFWCVPKTTIPLLQSTITDQDNRIV